MTRKILSVLLALVFMSGLSVTAAFGGAKPIKIGAPISLTGLYASDGREYYEGVVLAVEEINASGGLLGRPLKVITFDIGDQNAENIVAAGEKLIGRDKVDVLLSPYAGFGVDVEYFGRYDIPYLHSSATQNTVDMVAADPGRRNVFQTDDTQVGFAKASLAALLSLPYDYPNKKMVSLYADDQWSTLYARIMREGLIKKGWTVVMKRMFPYGTREWGPVLTRIRSLEPALICLEALSAEEGITFFRQFLKNPTNSLIWLGYGFALKEYPQMLGKEGDGLMGFAYCYPLDSKKGNHLRNAYKKRWGKEIPITMVGAGYDAVYIWAKAVERVGDPSDYDAVVKAIQTYPYEGSLGVYRFSQPGNYAPQGPEYPVTTIQMQGGKHVAIYRDVTPVKGAKFLLPSWIKK